MIALIARAQVNVLRELRGPAATDVRIVREPSGWSLAAPRNC